MAADSKAVLAMMRISQETMVMSAETIKAPLQVALSANGRAWSSSHGRTGRRPPEVHNPHHPTPTVVSRPPASLFADVLGAMAAYHLKIVFAIRYIHIPKGTPRFYVHHYPRLF